MKYLKLLLLLLVSIQLNSTTINKFLVYGDSPDVSLWENTYGINRLHGIEIATPPDISCENVQPVLSNSGYVLIPSEDIVSSSSNDLSFSPDFFFFTCQDLGENEVAIEIVDIDGNITHCTPIIYIHDNGEVCEESSSVQILGDYVVSPTCPGSADGSIHISVVGGQLPYTYLWNNGQTQDNLNNIPSGDYSVTVTDTNGYQDIASFFVPEGEDETPPDAICITNLAVDLQSTGEGGIASGAEVIVYTEELAGMSTDACGIASFSPESFVFTCEDLGENEVSVIVTDNNGNTNLCFSTIEIHDNNIICCSDDNVAPTAICITNLAVDLQSTGEGGIASGAEVIVYAEDLAGMSTDACGIASFSPEFFLFTCEDLGENEVTVIVTDNNGNTNLCFSTIEIQDNLSICCSDDNIPPAAICKNSIVVVLDELGNATITADDIDMGSWDDCGIDDISLDKNSFDCTEIGEHTIIMTVRDLNGNVNSSWSTVEVQDKVAPSIIVGATDITLECDGAGNVDEMDAWLDNHGGAIAEDACEVNWSYELLEFYLDCNSRKFLATFTASDPSGNETTTTGFVRILDTTPPYWTVPPADLVVDCDGTTDMTEVFNEWLNSFSGEDNCGLVEVNNSSNGLIAGCGATGSETVLFTLTDECQNAISQEATFSIVDMTPPEITCPGDIVVNNDPGVCSAVVDFTVEASDLCGDVNVFQTAGQSSGSSFPFGTTINIFKAIDECGNINTCSFTLTVNKTGDPDLLPAYTVIAKNEINLKENTVLSGGLGVYKADKKVKLEEATMVNAPNTFVTSPELELKGGSEVATYYERQFDESLLPEFLEAIPCDNNLDIPDNSLPVTLDLDCYGKVKVGKNVSITFSGHSVVNVKEMDLKEGSSVYFNQPTNLLIKKDLKGDKDVLILSEEHLVWLFVMEEVEIEDNSEVSCNIYVKKKMEVGEGKDWPIYMTGLFISEDKVKAKKNVIWNWDANYCPEATILPMLVNDSGTEYSTSLDGIKHFPEMLAYPNPVRNKLFIHFAGFEKGIASIEIINTLGELIWLSSTDNIKNWSEMEIELSNRFMAGVYFVKLVNENEVYTRQVVVEK